MIARFNLSGNPGIGSICLANDDAVLVPYNLEKEDIDALSEAMAAEIIPLSIGGTALIGTLCCGTSKRLIVSNIINQAELDILSTLKMEVNVFNSKLNALGNNILVNDNGALISSDYSTGAAEKISEYLGVDVCMGKIAGLTITGSAATVNNRGILCHPKVSDEELEILKNFFKVENASRGTINRGSPLIGAGCIVNSNGALCGEPTTGIELGRIEYTFGFI